MSMLRRVLRWASYVATAAVLFVMVATTADSIGRYLLSRPIKGVTESTESLLVVIVFMALAYAQVQKRHVAADVLVQRFSPRVQRAIDAGNLVVLIVLCAVVTAATLGDVRGSFVKGEIQWNLPYPIWMPRLFVPLGMFLLMLEFVAELVEQVRGRGQVRG